IQLGKICAVAHQTARRDEIAPIVDRGNGKACGKRDNLLAPSMDERVADDQERIRSSPVELGKGLVDLLFVTGGPDVQILHRMARGLLHLAHAPFSTGKVWIE